MTSFLYNVGNSFRGLLGVSSLVLELLDECILAAAFSKQKVNNTPKSDCVFILLGLSFEIFTALCTVPIQLSCSIGLDQGSKSRTRALWYLCWTDFLRSYRRNIKQQKYATFLSFDHEQRVWTKGDKVEKF